MSPVNARGACEDRLHAQIRYNTEHHILPTDCAIALSLLARGPELASAYDDIHAKFASHPHALDTFLQLLLDTRAAWSPDKIAQDRADRAELVAVNSAIEAHARALADLLDRRAELHNTLAFMSDTYYHVHDVIETAGQGNGHFRSRLQEPLAELRARFDLKYWPELGTMVRALADDAAVAQPEATDPITAAATASSRASRSDFVMALLAGIEDRRGTFPGSLPPGVMPSDATLASLVNVLLDLGPDELIDAAYLKGRRQRARDLAAALAS